MNSQWITPTPGLIAAPNGGAIPSSQVASGPYVTRLNIANAPVYVNLDGQPVTSLNYDLKLSPGRYTLMVAPSKITMIGLGASYQVGYESNLISQMLAWWPVGKIFAAAPTAGLDTTLASNASSVYVTQIIVQGSGELYVTLNGRTPTSGSYDYLLTDTGDYGPNSANLFYVNPNSIKVLGSGGINWKYGYYEYPQGNYDYPILGRGPYV